MKTISAKAEDVVRDWWIIDAEDIILGRMATKAATVLRGKHKPIYTPHVDTGDFVVVINANKVKLSGNKSDQKLYWRYTGYMGGERSVPVERQREEHPERIIMHAVKGMLPKGPLGRRMLKKLKVYGGSQHPHSAQQPKSINIDPRGK